MEKRNLILEKAIKGILNNTVTQIDLNGNNISDEGAIVLATAVEKNKTLTQLQLNSNKIGAEGARALASALEKNNTLIQLKLYSNKIGAEGARALASALEKNNTLTHISLGDNKIGDEGAKVLASALEKNNTLTHISLGYNNISTEGARALKGALEKNDTLTTLYLYNNKINFAFEKEIELKCKENSKGRVNQTVAVIQQRVETSENLLPEQKLLYSQVMQKVNTAAQIKVEEVSEGKEDKIEEVDISAVLEDVGHQTGLNTQEIELLKDIILEEKEARMEEKAKREMLEEKVLEEQAKREKLEEQVSQLQKLLLNSNNSSG